MSFEKEVEELRKVLARPGVKTVLVIGSTEEWMGCDEHRVLCDVLGKELSALNVNLLTGGTTGVPRRTELGFAKARRKRKHIVRVLPEAHKDDPVPSCGKTLIRGETMADRRRIITQCCDIAVMITGGPGTVHEATMVHERGFPVLVVQCTGGASGGTVDFPHRDAILKEAKELGLPTIGVDTKLTKGTIRKVAHNIAEAVKMYLKT